MAKSEASLSRRDWVILGAIVVIAVVLRAHHLAAWTFEEDELYTLRDATDLGARAAAAGGPGVKGRPLYYLLEHVLLRLFPGTPLSLRLPAATFGLLGVAATWRLGRRVFGTGAAAVASLVAAISPWLLYESQFARYWTLVYLLSALTAIALWDAMQTERPGAYTKVLAVALLGAASHPTFLFPLAGLGLATCFASSEDRIRWKWPSRVAFVRLWLPFAGVLAIAWLALRLTGNQSALRNWGPRGLGATLQLVPAMVQWLAPGIVMGAVAGAAMLFLHPSAPSDRRWAVLATLGTLAATGLLLLASLRTAVYADYGTAAVPLVLVALGGAVQRAAERFGPARSTALVAGGVLCCTAVLPGTVSHLADGTRFDYRPSFEHIRRAGQGGLVVGAPNIIARYYAPDFTLREMPADSVNLSAWLADVASFWVVGAFQRKGLIGDDGTILAWLQRHCGQALRTEAHRLDYRVYRVELYWCDAQWAPPRIAGRSGRGAS